MRGVAVFQHPAMILSIHGREGMLVKKVDCPHGCILYVSFDRYTRGYFVKKDHELYNFFSKYDVPSDKLTVAFPTTNTPFDHYNIIMQRL